MLAMAVRADPELVASMRAAVEAMARASEQTLSALADSAGLAHSTLTRFMHSDVAHALTARTLSKLMDAAHRRITELDRTHPEGAQRRHDAWQEMRRLLNAPVPSFDRAGSRPVFIVGRAGIDLPMSGELVPLHPAPVVADPRFAASLQFAIEIVDAHASPTYAPGTVLLCVPPDAAREFMRAEGRHVVTIERNRESARACVRELRRADDGDLWAWSLSSSPTAPRPVLVPSDPFAMPWPKTVALVGVVVGAYSPQ